MVSKTISVQSGDGGDEKATDSVSGTISGYWDSKSYTYQSDLSNPYQVTFSLDGPTDADFDLYVTVDGRSPSRWDYDKRSVTRDSQEQVVVDDVDAGQEFGIQVDAYEGSGNFTLTVEELGK